MLQGCEQLDRKCESTLEGVQVPVPHVVPLHGFSHGCPPHWPRHPAEGAGVASGAGLVHVEVLVPPPHGALHPDQAEKPPDHEKARNQPSSRADKKTKIELTRPMTRNVGRIVIGLDRADRAAVLVAADSDVDV